MKDHNEFTCTFLDGTRDWIDPVVDFTEDEDRVVIHNGFYSYTFEKSKMKNWTVRPYSTETTYDVVE